MLSAARHHELAVMAEMHARDFAVSGNAGELPQPGEKLCVVFLHKSSPLYSLFRDAQCGAELDAECWCAVLDAVEFGVEPFPPGHVGLSLAIGDDVSTRVIRVSNGAAS